MNLGSVKLKFQRFRVTFEYPTLDAFNNIEKKRKTISTYAVGFEQAERFARARLSWATCQAPCVGIV